MKRTWKTVGATTIIGFLLTCAYLIGTANDGDIAIAEDGKDNYVDMRTVTDFTAVGDGLYLYCNDGSGYYWEQ